MMYEIVNPDSLFYSKNSKLVNDFMDFSSKNLRFERPVTIDFVEDDSAGQDPLGKTAHYNPQEMSIVVYTTNRHPKDILRSLSHELVHHCQNCEERIPSNSSTEEGYAQTDKTMRSLESEAYLKGNIMNFRDFEDQYKEGQYKEGQYKMRKNKKQVNEVGGAPNINQSFAADKQRRKDQGPDLPPVEKKELERRIIDRQDVAKRIGVEPDKVAYVDLKLLNTIAQLKKLSDSSPLSMEAPTVKSVRREIAALDDRKAFAALYKATPFLWRGRVRRLRASGGKKSRLSKKQREGKHIISLQKAIEDYHKETKDPGMKIKVTGKYNRETQRAINKLRRKHSGFPKRNRDFEKSVSAITLWLQTWLEVREDEKAEAGKNVKPAPAKVPAPSSGSTNTALNKSADLSKESDKLMADWRRINGMAPGQLKRDAERQFKSQYEAFKKKRAAARGFGVNENVGPAFDQAEVSKKGEKRPLRENKKADRSEMLSRILTERLLGRNVKIKNN